MEPETNRRTSRLLGLFLVFAGLAINFTSIGFYPLSKTLWSALDLMMTPLEPGEVDPRFDPHVKIEPEGTSSGGDA